MRSCRPRTGNARTQTEPSRSGKGRALRAVAMSLAQGNESEAGHRAGLPDAGHGLAASSPRRPLPPTLSGRAPSGRRGRPAPRFQPCALLVHSQPRLGRGRRRGRGRGMPGPRTGAGGGLGCSKKVTLFPFHWIKRLKLCLAFAVLQDRPASAETCPPSPPGAAAASRVRAGGWHKWTPVVSAKGTRGWGALDPELRPPRRGAEPARGRGPDGDGGVASSGRSWARSAPATTPIPPGAKPAECNLVLKGNAPLHAC